MTRDEAITIMQVYKEELEHRIAKIDYDVGAIDLYSIQVEAYDMAIEALSAEAVTHGRLIDADALSEKLCETTIFIKDGEVFQRMINDAPTASAEAVHKPDYSYEADMVKRLRAVQGWIPCSERLPNDNREVLISCEWGIDIGQHEEYGWRSEWVNHYDDDNVLAWMPLPKPYEPKTERRG